jgi:hypothetical protein
MNYNTITEDIIRLSDERHIWSSTLFIPVNGSEEFLDISSAAMGYNSSIPPGATNQPDTFPTRKGLISCYRFDPEIFKHESSWDDLRSILRDVASGRVSLKELSFSGTEMCSRLEDIMNVSAPNTSAGLWFLV